jgi:hypothetical protein
MPSNGVENESTIVFSGVSEFRAATVAMKLRLREASRSIVTRGAVILADSMKEQYRARPGGRRVSQKTGRVYYQGAPNFPAQPPKPTIRTGNTRASIRPQLIAPISIDTWMSQTGPTVDYERFPELGTTRIKVPFPAVRMGTENAEERIRVLVESEFALAIEES